jgi:hypothetical protein
MINLPIFYLHVIAAVAVFTKRWQEGGIGEGLLGVAFVLLIFGVGWSITTIIVGWFMTPEGFGPLLNRDASALLLLTLLEVIFYTIQTRRKRARAASASVPAA